MNKFLVSFVLVMFLQISNVFAQYQLTSDYLINPQQMLGHVDSCAKFWFQSYDAEYGGFYENVAHDGSVINSTKTMLGQTRTTYGMVRAFMLSGDTTYLGYAHGALNFMYENAWDEVNTGWFNEMSRDGSLNAYGDHNNDKWSFMQHYALLGIGAMVEATRAETDIEYLLNGRAAIDNNLWDSRPDYLGYYENANFDWSNPNGKGFTSCMDGITTHLLNMYLLYGTDQYKNRFLTVADKVVEHLLPAMDHFSYGFPEHFSSDWEPDIYNTYVFTGHFLKTAWCLARAYLIEPNEDYLDFSTLLIEEVLEKGYDSQYGGCYSNYNGVTGAKYGTDKEWWQLEQAFTSGIMNYYISGNEDYLQMADETLKFYMEHFVDNTNGEVYTSTSRTGGVANDRKASYWKAGYHSIEFGYYVYLYGNLYLHNAPVSLHYRFEYSDTNREIKLYPLAIEDENLTISAVTLDGISYNAYDASSRMLNVPPGLSGVFKVTFINNIDTSIIEADIPQSFALLQNYPNPFNPSTIIEYQLHQPSPVTLEIFNILGQQIKTLVNDYKNAGSYKVIWNGDDNSGNELPSGFYFIYLKSENHLEVRKAVLLK